MKRPIEILEGVLEDAHQPKSDRVRGRFGTREVEVRFIDRGVGSTRDPYTEVWFLGAARRPDLRLHVIPQTTDDAEEVRQGRGTDVLVGDEAFDAAFLVEAAPADVVSRLFDPSIRERMMSIRPLGVHTHEEGLLVEKSGWDNERFVRAMVETGDAVVTRIPIAFEEADRAAVSRAGYREMMSAEQREATRRGEVAAVLARKTERKRRRETIVWVTALVIVVVALVLGILMRMRREPGMVDDRSDTSVP